MPARKVITGKKNSQSQRSSIAKKSTITSFSPSPLISQRVKNLKDKKVILPILGLIVLIFLGYLASKFLIVAWVDKKPITRFSYYSQLDQKYGKNLREQMITELLIESESQKRKMSVSKDEVDAQIKKIADEQGGQDRLNQILQLQGISQDELRNLVRLQLLRQKMFGQGVFVTDAEITSYYEQNKDTLGASSNQDASTEAKLKDSVRQQLLQQKINATFSAWLQQNVNSNRVVRVQ